MSSHSKRGFVWMAVMSLFTIFILPRMAFGDPLSVFILILAAMLIVTGVLMSFAMHNQGKLADEMAAARLRSERTRDTKPKRGGSLAELMAVLEEDDVYDLRQHIKQRLMEQIDSGSEEYAEKFEELLKSSDRQKRK